MKRTVSINKPILLVLLVLLVFAAVFGASKAITDKSETLRRTRQERRPGQIKNFRIIPTAPLCSLSRVGGSIADIQ